MALPPGFSRNTMKNLGPATHIALTGPQTQTRDAGQPQTPNPSPPTHEHPIQPPSTHSLLGENAASPEMDSPSTITQDSPGRLYENLYIDPQSGLEYVRMEPNEKPHEEEHYFSPLPPPPRPQLGNVDSYLMNLATSNNRRRQREAEAATPAPPPVVPGTMRTVARPEAGWPQIHGSSPGYLWDGIAEDQMGQWLADRKPNVLVQAHGKNSWDAEAGQTADDIAGILKTIYNIETISVAPGNEQLDEDGESRNKNKNDPPHTFLVQDISAALADRLIATTCIATPTLQLMLYPLRFLGPQTYIGSLSGLVATNLIQISDVRRGQLCDDIRDLLYKQVHEPLMAFACRDVPENDFSDVVMDPDDEVRMILGDLEIKIINTKVTGSRQAANVNMYIPLEYEDDTLRENILNALGKVKFRTAHFGTGTYHAGWKCTGCRGTDHPTGLCPYREVPNWTLVTNIAPAATGPPATQSSQTRGTSRGLGRGGYSTRGGRGSNGSRGNSRGRGQ